jgi:hypothetical protein
VEPPKELMNRKGKAVNKEIGKCYPVSLGGLGVASSPGIFIFPSSVSRPNFFSLRWSADVNLDLSHPETFFFSARTMAGLAEVFLMRLVLVMAAEQAKLGSEEKAKSRERM